MSSPRVVLDHIGIAVAELDAALTFYRDVLGLDVDAAEEVASQRVRATFVRGTELSGGSRAASLELLEATADDSPIAKYLGKRGPGIHHIAFRVEDLDATILHLRARGVRLIDETPRIGAHGARIAFVHPASTHGVLVELIQPRARA